MSEANDQQHVVLKKLGNAWFQSKKKEEKKT